MYTSLVAREDRSVVVAGYYEALSQDGGVPEFVELDAIGPEVWRLQVTPLRAARNW